MKKVSGRWTGMTKALRIFIAAELKTVKRG